MFVQVIVLVILSIRTEPQNKSISFYTSKYNKTIITLLAVAPSRRNSDLADSTRRLTFKESSDFLTSDFFGNFWPNLEKSSDHRLDKGIQPLDRLKFVGGNRGSYIIIQSGSFFKLFRFPCCFQPLLTPLLADAILKHKVCQETQSRGRRKAFDTGDLHSGVRPVVR